MKYITRDREAGNIIEEFNTKAEAYAAIKAYEEADKADGNYTEDFYEVADLADDGAYESVLD